MQSYRASLKIDPVNNAYGMFVVKIAVSISRDHDVRLLRQR